jgi:hypothetical protein
MVFLLEIVTGKRQGRLQRKGRCGEITLILGKECEMGKKRGKNDN